QVSADHTSIPVHAEEIGQLTGPATDLQHESAGGNLLVQEGGEHRASGAGLEPFPIVQIIVVWKRRALVELLHDVGDVDLLGIPLVGHEELWDAVDDRVVPTTGRAPQTVRRVGQLAAATGTAHQLSEERRSRKLVTHG